MRFRGVTAILVGLALITSGCQLRPVDLEGSKQLALRTTITDSAGRVLAQLFRENRVVVELADLPPHTIDAVLAAEDRRFYEHEGYDLRAIARAAIVNLREGRIVQGGSTITQQYVENTYFRSRARTFPSKAREVRYAIEVEKVMSKNEILEGYLNTVYFGEGAYGIESASENYFGHSASELTIGESALLAGVIRAPSRDNPRDHPRVAMARRDQIVRRMEKLGMISSDDANSALAAPTKVTRKPPQIAFHEPYFVEAVKREVLNDERFGGEHDRARALYKGGLQIETTLDSRLQRMAGDAINSVLNQPGDPAAALVAIDPKTGEIVAMIGGRDWKASQVNLALGKAGGGSGRQPGSSFKPIVAASALESRIPLETRYQSGSIRVTFPDDSVWSVASQDHGLISLRQAMINSINGPFARLALQIGAGRVAAQAEMMGVRARLPSVPSIALGSVEVSVLDMAAAYATIANHGRALEPTTIRSIDFPNGITLEPERETVAAMSPGNAFMLTEVLQQVIEEGTGTAARLDRPAAGKTGTSNDYADAWFVGYTPQLVAAVWVGYPEGRIPMTSVHGGLVLGGTLPAAIWRNFMLAAHRGLPVLDFEIPEEALVTVRIDPKSGLLAAPWCPGKNETMLRELVPLQYCPEPVIEPPEPIFASPSPSKGKGDDEGKGQKDEDEGKPDDEPEPEPSDKPTPKPEPEPEPTDKP